jgi:hypothetical protein
MQFESATVASQRVGLILRGAAAAIADGRVLRSLYNAISLSFGLQRDERDCNPKQAMDIFQRPD